MQAYLDETIGRTIVLDRFVVELRISASIDAETQRDILFQLDESSFSKRLLPSLLTALKYAKLQQIEVVIVR